MAPSVVCAVVPVTPADQAASVVARLRELVRTFAGERTLTCEFQPGGKLDGVGIRSKHYCANCAQSFMWHEVAAGATFIEAIEGDLRRDGEEVGDACHES